MKILIVGGGTAGLVAANILNKHLNATVDIVKSDKIGIVGVGEGSTEHFKEFMDFVGIDQISLIKNADATYKSGIMFDGWSDKPYLHSITGNFSQRIGQYSLVYGRQIANDQEYMNHKIIWENKINPWFLNNTEEFPFNQFHFNTYKLNEYLSDFSKKNGIKIFEDEILDVELNSDGSICKLIGEKKEYEYDFYIDSTGFRKVLMNKLGVRWKSFSKYLKANSAITFPTGDEKNYNLWTLAKAMDYGWMFKLPVWGRYGNGYIFDKNYISFDQAKEEVCNVLGKEKIDFGKEFSFDPGHVEDVWIKNCVAVGLSAAFVEPLEATSIGLTIQQTFLLMHKIISYDEKTIKNYNKSFVEIMENIRDFIFIHYMTKKRNTDFWKDASSLDPPDSIKENLETWKNRLPIKEDFSEGSLYKLFGDQNYILVMHGLKMFNIKNIQKEYSRLSDSYKSIADKIVSLEENFEKSINTISHKEYLSIIRERQ